MPDKHAKPAGRTEVSFRNATASAIAHPIGGRDSVFRLYQADTHLTFALADVSAQAFLDRLDLVLDAKITLRIAFVSDYAHGGLVN